MRGGTLGIAFLVVAALASRTSAGGPGELADALKDGKFKMLRIAAGTADGKTGSVKAPVTSVHAELLTEGKPVSRAQLEGLTGSVRNALERLWPEGLAYVEIDIYAPARLLDRGTPAARSLRIHTKSNNPSGALWTPDAASVDTKKAVHWYAKAVWFRPYTIRGAEVTDFNGWELIAWYAEGNATPRPDEGSTDHAPEKVK